MRGGPASVAGGLEPAGFSAGERDAPAAAMDGLARSFGRGLAERPLAADPGPGPADDAPCEVPWMTLIGARFAGRNMCSKLNERSFGGVR